MTLQTTLQRLEATACTWCHGHGSTLGVFHRLPCLHCHETGYVGLANQHPVDTIAAAIIAQEVNAAAERRSKARWAEGGTPDNWTLKNNFRGD